MKVIFVGVKNINFFSKNTLNEFEKIFLMPSGDNQKVDLTERDKVIYIDEVLDPDLMTKKLNLDECISSLKEIVINGDDFKVFCNQESNLNVAEKIRSHFNIYDHMHGGTNIFLNKIVMKNLLRKAGIRTPKYIELNNKNSQMSFKEIRYKLGHTFVIKPQSSVGSRGISIINTEEEFLLFNKKSLSDNCHYQAEEFINGDLYEFDVAIKNSEILYHNVSRYSCPMLELQNGRTLASIMLSRNDIMHQRVSKFGKDCIRNLNVKNGCFHMEIFHSVSNELVFLEVAARSPGLMTVPAYYSWEGVNMYDLELLLQCNIDIDEKNHEILNHKTTPAFFVVYPKTSGVVRAINHPKTQDAVEEYWKVMEGDVMKPTNTNIDFAAMFFIRCTSIERAQIAFYFFTNKFRAITVTQFGTGDCNE